MLAKSANAVCDVLCDVTSEKVSFGIQHLMDLINNIAISNLFTVTNALLDFFLLQK